MCQVETERGIHGRIKSQQESYKMLISRVPQEKNKLATGPLHRDSTRTPALTAFTQLLSASLKMDMNGQIRITRQLRKTSYREDRDQNKQQRKNWMEAERTPSVCTIISIIRVTGEIMFLRQ